jgi:hypothetical protein
MRFKVATDSLVGWLQALPESTGPNDKTTVGADRIVHGVWLARRFFAADFRHLEKHIPFCFPYNLTSIYSIVKKSIKNLIFFLSIFKSSFKKSSQKKPFFLLPISHGDHR